ncbi:MAG: (2Fe-2S)-binding protein [Burkholderiales bacterium]
MARHVIELTVNGEAHAVEVPAKRLLADLLRDDLLLTGTKRGCETGVCGACSVLVDGRLVKSCLMLAVQARGAQVSTVEGLATSGQLNLLQQCFAAHGGLQCGYCTPGFLMAATALLAANPNPTEAEVREALDGNLCRCTGYAGIVESVLAAAGKSRGN